MSYLSFEYETVDLYSLNGEEPTSRLLDVEVDIGVKRSDLVVKITQIWCCDSNKLIGDAPYKLSLGDMASIQRRAEDMAHENYGDILSDHKDAAQDYFSITDLD